VSAQESGFLFIKRARTIHETDDKAVKYANQLTEDIQKISSEYVVTSTLQIRLLKASDFGKYTCNVRQGFGIPKVAINIPSECLDHRQELHRKLRQELQNKSRKGITFKDTKEMCGEWEHLWDESDLCYQLHIDSSFWIYHHMHSGSADALEKLHTFLRQERQMDQNPVLRAVLDEEDRLSALLYNQSSPAVRYRWPLQCWSLSSALYPVDLDPILFTTKCTVELKEGPREPVRNIP
jgi:hypothetical protein